KEEKIRLLRQRLVEREAQMKTADTNGCGGPLTSGGINNGTHPPAVTTTGTSLGVYTSATSSHLPPAASLAITQAAIAVAAMAGVKPPTTIAASTIDITNTDVNTPLLLEPLQRQASCNSISSSISPTIAMTVLQTTTRGKRDSALQPLIQPEGTSATSDFDSAICLGSGFGGYSQLTTTTTTRSRAASQSSAFEFSDNCQ
ncbi:uncharacterized protein LOC133333007, partial [Musca vetustissima]|uniref:uncharacterized protein LOC133333007 n=1 Tax=Musca vetustissima TaxID=27455 RepID=UPI002AB62B7D